MNFRKRTECLKQLSVTIPREEYRLLGDFLDQNLERASVKDCEYSSRPFKLAQKKT